MKVDELRAALEAAGVEDTEGKPALVERLVAAQRAAASPQPMEEDSDAMRRQARNGHGSSEAAERPRRPRRPAAFDEEEATRRAKKMKVEELRAALEAAGEDTEGTKPVLVERAVAAARAAAQAMEEEDEYGEEGYDSDEGYPVEEGEDIAVGARLLGKFSGDGRYYDCVVEEVTENGYVVLFTEYDEEKNYQGSTCATTPPRTTLAPATTRATSSRKLLKAPSCSAGSLMMASTTTSWSKR